MLRYAITSRALFPGDEHEKQAALLYEASRWAAEGIDIIQLREKDLPAADIAALAREILRAISTKNNAISTKNSAIRQKNSPTKLLINSRPDIALATGAYGVHLTATSHELTPAQVRSLYASTNLPAPVITVSCHTLEEVRRARENHADAILFAPVFEKTFADWGADQGTLPGQGLDRLRDACRAASPVPIYALGGVTLENAPSCLAAGAAGIAGIRLFHDSPGISD
jgi:thiamine-phosphate pyrophosphorylase